MRFLGMGGTGKSPDTANASVDMTSSTVSSSRRSTRSTSPRKSRSASASYERSRRSTSASRREPSSSRRSDSYSARESSGSRRPSDASRASSRGRSGAPQSARSSSSRGRSASRGRSSERRSSSGRSTSSASLDRSNRARNASDASRASSRGRSRVSTRDSVGSNQRRSSSRPRTREGSSSASRASSRGRSSASRSSSRDRSSTTRPSRSSSCDYHTSPASSSSPRQTYALTRKATGQIVSSPNYGTRQPSPRRSSSRSRQGSRSDASVGSRMSVDTKTLLGLRGSPRSVSSRSTRSQFGKSRKDRSSKSEPLLDKRMVIEIDETQKGGQHEKNTDLSVAIEGVESDLESGTVGGNYTEVTDKAYYGVANATPLENPEQMVNGLLIQLKFESEVCPWPLRFMIVICAIGMLTTSIVPHILGYPLNVADIIISPLTIFMSLFIILLEGRFSFISNDPVGCRASVRGVIVKNIGALKLVWGRGLLYVFTGLLQVAQMHTLTNISGGLMVLVGFVVIIAGASSAAQLTRLKKSLTDDAHLLYLFAKYDRDKDGYQVVKDFARFIIAVGLDLDDAYTLGAFKAIDKDHNGKISFIDFHKWWTQCTVRGNHVFRMKEQEINNFSTSVGSW